MRVLLAYSLIVATTAFARADIQHYPNEEMIDAHGHKLQLLRGGSGGPTVVFEHGLGSDLGTWMKVQPAVDKFTSTVSYSRAGFGASELATGPRSPLVIAEELHTVLAQAGIKPPYVLVGHSTGGVYVRVFAARYPGEVVGLVLVEGSHERQSHEINGSDPVALGKLAEVPEGMPAAIKAEYTGLLPVFISGRLDGTDKLPDVPMVVLTSLRSPGGGATGAKQVDKMRALHSEIFQSTRYGMHIVTSKSGHFIQVDQPDLVINAIRWVVDAARAPR